MGDACCEPLLQAGQLRANQRRVLWLVLVINVSTFAMMVWAGVRSQASSLFSGALDNLGDATTYALSLAVVGAGVASQSRVALAKGILILMAAAAVAAQILWRLLNPSVPILETFGIAAGLNLAANLGCLALLTPYRGGDINMASAWECSRNDVAEGIGVLAAAGAVLYFEAAWPDLIVAVALLALFVRSGVRVTRGAVRGLKNRGAQPAGLALAVPR